MSAAQAVVAIWVIALGACRAFTDAPTDLVVSPSALRFAARAGGNHPPLQFLTILQTAQQQGRWSATVDSTWIGLVSAGDSLPFYLGVGVATELAVGAYSGNITVRLADTDHSQVIPVALTLTTTTPLDGRWAGIRDTVNVTLTLVDTAGAVTGAGTLEPRNRAVTVTGAYAYPSLTLRLIAGADTTMLTGSFTDDNTVTTTLSGGGFAGFAITLNRQ